MTTARRRLATALLAIAALPALAGCQAIEDVVVGPVPCGAVGVVPLLTCTPPPTPSITTVTFTQTQAVPGFDDRTFSMRDAAAVADLEAALEARGFVDTTIVGDCEGGRTTVLTLDATPDGPFTVTVDTCTDDSLAAELDALVAEWHAAGLTTPVP